MDIHEQFPLWIFEKKGISMGTHQEWEISNSCWRFGSLVLIIELLLGDLNLQAIAD